jgi:hypothetical protein
VFREHALLSILLEIGPHGVRHIRVGTAAVPVAMFGVVVRTSGS